MSQAPPPPQRPVAKPGLKSASSRQVDQYERRKKGVGTPLGWALAGFLVVGLALIVVLQLVLPQPSKPTKTSRLEMTQLKDAPWPDALLGAKPTGAGDAAADYREAAEIYLKNQQAIDAACLRLDDMRKGKYILPAETLAAMEKISACVAKAAQKQQLRYTFDQTGALSMQPAFAPALNVRMVFESLKTLFMHYNSPADGKAHRDAEQALRTAKLSLAMGRQFMDERRLVAMVQVGIEIQKQSLGLFQSIYQPDAAKPPSDKAVAAAYEKYGSQLQEVSDFYFRKLEIVHDTRLNPGDIFNLAENDQDLAWRVQGVLGLGLVKFIAGKRGDKRYVAKLMEKFKHDSNPLIVSAAEAADKFSKTDFDAYRPPNLNDAIYWPAGAQSDAD